MFSFASRRLPPEPDAHPAPAAPSLESRLREAVATVGRQASSVGREAAEVRGALEDVQRTSANQVQVLNALANQVLLVTRSQDRIREMSRNSTQAR